jgi:hypothetical protein
MNRHSIKIGNAPRGSRNGIVEPPGPAAPVLSVDMGSMTFNVDWDGPAVDHWEIFLCENPPGPFDNAGSMTPQHLPWNYWDVIPDFNVDWAIYVIGRDADENDITPQSNVLTGHSPAHS